MLPYTRWNVRASVIGIMHGLVLKRALTRNLHYGIAGVNYSTTVSGLDRHRHYSCRQRDRRRATLGDPCFSSGRCTGLECIAFVGQNIVDVLGISSPAENTAIQGIL